MTMSTANAHVSCVRELRPFRCGRRRMGIASARCAAGEGSGRTGRGRHVDARANGRPPEKSDTYTRSRHAAQSPTPFSDGRGRGDQGRRREQKEGWE